MEPLMELSGTRAPDHAVSGDNIGVFVRGTAASAPTPTARSVTQQAPHLTMTLQELRAEPQFLIRDRDSEYTASFDDVFRSEGIRIIRTPMRAPQANAHAERRVQTLRRKCPDSL